MTFLTPNTGTSSAGKSQELDSLFHITFATKAMGFLLSTLLTGLSVYLYSNILRAFLVLQDFALTSFTDCRDYYYQVEYYYVIRFIMPPEALKRSASLISRLRSFLPTPQYTESNSSILLSKTTLISCFVGIGQMPPI